MFFLKSFVDKNIRSCCLRAVVSRASCTRCSTAVPPKRAVSFSLAFNNKNPHSDPHDTPSAILSRPYI